MRRVVLTVPLCVFLLLGSNIRSLSADGQGKKGGHSGPKLLNAHVVGSTPNITIRTIVSGGAPWVVREGKAQVDASGRVKVQVQGLLIGAGASASGDPVPAALVGTVGPVTTVHAALTCGGPGGGVPFTITPTDGVPLSAQGDFVINAHITLPTTCDRPILLIRVGEPALGGPFIAVADPNAEGHDDEDNDD